MSIAEQSVAFITDPKQVISQKKANAQSFDLEKLYLTRSVGATDWSPDAKQIVFVTNVSGRNNLWLVPAGGGWPVQLTVSNQRQTSPAWSPDGKSIAYVSDYDGDEQWDVFIVSPLSGEVINLTKTKDISEEGPAWSPDGKWLAYIVKPRSSSTYEIDLVNVLTRQVKHLTTGTPKEQSNFGPIWSRDGKQIVFTQQHATGKDSNVFLVDVVTGQRTLLTPHTGEYNYTASDLSPDGKRVLLTSNAGNGYDNVGLLDVGSKKIEWLTQDKWEVNSANFSPDGTLATWTANVDGNQEIFTCDLATKKAVSLPLAKGVNSFGGAESPFTRDGSRLLFYHNGANAPQDIWVYDRASSSSHQITSSFVGGIRGESMVEPYLAHYPSKDGKWQISAFVYMPHNLERNGQSPALVYVHGGPQAQTMNSFNRNVQYLVNQGYVVIAPNYRGSTGYGKEFQDANRFDMGGGDLADCVAAADWIKQTGYVDPKKLVIMGGSYGGYLTMMGVTKASDVWAAGVAIVPFVNWFTEIKNEDPLLREYDIATMGDPADPKNKQLFEDRSPAYHLDNIKASLMMLAGGHDPRCPASETRQVQEAIEKRGGKVEVKIYENEGHGFAKVENQIDAYKRVAAFLKLHVPPAECGCTLE
ncbi:MAG: S9 family peptidase [Acidobacteriota bacterium]|nr:S9 family peptidase [Acidobacteriota bacterium]